MHLAADRRYGYTDVGGNFNTSRKTGNVSRRPADKLPGKGLSDRFDSFHTGESPRSAARRSGDAGYRSNFQAARPGEAFL
jgi:hypothetical protein